MKQAELEKKVNNMQISLEKLQADFLALKGETTVNFLKLDQKIQEVAEKVTRIPKMYDMLDAFITELKPSRQEQALLSHKVGNHEARITKLEKSKA